MRSWVIPTLSEILARAQPTVITDSQTKAERCWCGAIASLNELLGSDPCDGLILSASPVLTHPDSPMISWLFAPVQEANGSLFQLPPPEDHHSSESNAFPTPETTVLLPRDPLIGEQFALVLTPHFSVLLVLARLENGDLGFLFSFDPQEVALGGEALRSRVALTGTPDRLQYLDHLYHQFAPIAPSYRTVIEFTRLMVHSLPEPWGAGTPTEKRLEKLTSLSRASQDVCSRKLDRDRASSSHPDLELLTAIAHEVKTPLATIRTYTRLLLKSPNLPPEVLQRLQIIDRECTEQIDRFNLIFRAVELETAPIKPEPTHLTPTSLVQVFQQSIPRWQKQASRRNVTLDVVLPQHTPTVVSDPHLLDQVLTNVIHNFTSTLPTGSHVQVAVTPAGDQLKLQLVCETKTRAASASRSPFKALGQLLMFQPETGNLSLNLTVTKNLFETIGGKLLIRQRPQQGAVMTIFLPMNLRDFGKINP